MSFQGVLGYGTSKKPAPDHAAGNEIPLNFLGTGFHTRMLILVCPKDWDSNVSFFIFFKEKHTSVRMFLEHVENKTNCLLAGVPCAACRTITLRIVECGMLYSRLQFGIWQQRNAMGLTWALKGLCGQLCWETREIGATL